MTISLLKAKARKHRAKNEEVLRFRAFPFNELTFSAASYNGFLSARSYRDA